MSNIYPYRVTFVVTFVSGILEGIVTSDSLGFVSVESAQNWIDAVRDRELSNGRRFSDFVIMAA